MSNVLGDDWDENDAKQLSQQLEKEYAAINSPLSLLDYLRGSGMTDEQIYAAYGPLQAEEWGLDEPDWA